MKKTFYYTLDNELIRVYLIDNNIPTEVCRVLLKVTHGLSARLKDYLIEFYNCDKSDKLERL